MSSPKMLIRASQDFVDVCCQHAAYIAGRGDIEESIQSLVLFFTIDSIILSVQLKPANNTQTNETGINIHPPVTW